MVPVTVIVPAFNEGASLADTLISLLTQTVAPAEILVVDDCSTDDTAAVQAFVDYLTTNHLYGSAPKGTYKLTSKINFPQTYSWGIIGAGQDATIFKQYTDNVPVFDLGASVVDSMHGFLLSDMQFTYANSQPAANTAANPILFSAMGFQGYMARIRFMRGAYAIKVATGIA